jgi:hypothetical protein
LLLLFVITSRDEKLVKLDDRRSKILISRINSSKIQIFASFHRRQQPAAEAKAAKAATDFKMSKYQVSKKIEPQFSLSSRHTQIIIAIIAVSLGLWF